LVGGGDEMKKATAVLIVLMTAGTVFGQQADVVYVEGIVDLKLADGERMEAFIGDYLERGDTIITDQGSQAELEQENGSLIKIAEDTIFTFQEMEVNGEKRSVLSTTIGAVAFKFNRFTGKEPLIATPGTVAGVRGTEFQVFAGLDGATLVVVATGKVEVEAQGQKVELLPEEGVEIPAGQPPGEKFEVLRGQLDFSEWNSGRLENMLDDPAGAARGIEKGMEAFRSKIAELNPIFEANFERLEEERDKLPKIEDEKGKEARKEHYAEVVFPLEVETSYMRLNLRYYALSALSFRRFVLGPMYARVKSAFINNLESAEYRDFMKVYERTLADYERDITPLLVEADI
jgi:hypothetical protein